MFIKLTGLIAAIGMAASMISFSADVQAADAVMGKVPDRECKTGVIERTGGSARTMLFARKKARDAWRQKVKTQIWSRLDVLAVCQKSGI